VLAGFAVPMVSSATSGVKLRDQANAIADLIGLAKLQATAEFSLAALRDLGAVAILQIGTPSPATGRTSRPR
jgi:Tfp pilus assembly protein FimT